MRNYFIIKQKEIESEQARFVVELQADCAVYEGHFPGNPIAPGACNIEMVRRCASIALGRELRISAIRVCKFMMLLRPGQPEQLTIDLRWKNDRMDATIWAEDKPAVQLKLTVV